MTKEQIEEMATVVLQGLDKGWADLIKHNETGAGMLITKKQGTRLLVPPEVMDWLMEHDFISTDRATVH